MIIVTCFFSESTIVPFLQIKLRQVLVDGDWDGHADERVTEVSMFEVAKVPYLRLVSDATWHSRTSSWSVYVDVPQSILNLHLNRQAKPSGVDVMQQKIVSRFHNKVVVNEECITIGGESTSNVVDLFVGDSAKINSTINRFECDLANLSLVLLQQIASQIVHWLFTDLKN